MGAEQMRTYILALLISDACFFASGLCIGYAKGYEKCALKMRNTLAAIRREVMKIKPSDISKLKKRKDLTLVERKRITAIELLRSGYSDEEVLEALKNMK